MMWFIPINIHESRLHNGVNKVIGSSMNTILVSIFTINHYNCDKEIVSAYFYLDYFSVNTRIHFCNI